MLHLKRKKEWMKQDADLAHARLAHLNEVFA